MDEKEVQHILIEILRSALNREACDVSIKEKITPDILRSLYHLAKKHDVAHILSDFVYRNQIEIEAELQGRLQRDEFLSVYRCEQLKFTFEEICRTFDDAEIPYIPLKGSVIRPYYPCESMRTSCDIDILIHEDDLDCAIACLESSGYRCGDKHYHDVSMYSPNKIHLELHFNIQENIDSLDVVLKDAWQYAMPTVGSRYDFKKAFWVYHMYAHMAYHFLAGGCGVRALMDIWIAEHKMEASYSCAEELLKKAGIYQFAVEMSNLGERCFTTSDHKDGHADVVLKYIFMGGVYGSTENNIAVKKSQINSSTGYVFKRLFLPYQSMIILYPVLKKAPCLLPFCWIARWMRALFRGKSKRLLSEISCANNLSDSMITEVKEIRARLGL